MGKRVVTICITFMWDTGITCLIETPTYYGYMKAQRVKDWARISVYKQLNAN